MSVDNYRPGPAEQMATFNVPLGLLVGTATDSAVNVAANGASVHGPDGVFSVVLLVANSHAVLALQSICGAAIAADPKSDSARHARNIQVTLDRVVAELASKLIGTADR